MDITDYVYAILFLSELQNCLQSLDLSVKMVTPAYHSINLPLRIIPLRENIEIQLGIIST